MVYYIIFVCTAINTTYAHIYCYIVYNNTFTLLLCNNTFTTYFPTSKCTLIDPERQRRGTDVCGNRDMAPLFGQLAYISSWEKCCKCVIIHNISVNLCIIVPINNVPIYSGHGFVHIQSELLKKTRWARIVDKCLPKNASNQSNGVRLNIDEIRLCTVCHMVIPELIYHRAM